MSNIQRMNKQNLVSLLKWYKKEDPTDKKDSLMLFKSPQNVQIFCNCNSGAAINYVMAISARSGISICKSI